MSEPGRLFGVITSPGEAFDDIVQGPRWYVPLSLSLICACVMMFLFMQHVGVDRMLKKAFENEPRLEQLTPEQRSQAMEQQKKIVPVMMWVGPLVGIPLVSACMAGVLLGVFNLALGAQFKFKNVFGVVCYSGVIGVLNTILIIVVMYLKPPEDFDIQNPTAFNLGAFLSQESPKWLQALLGSFDLFTIWTIVVMSIGMRALDKKRTLGSCLTGVIAPWVVWVLCKTGWAAIFR